MKNSSICRERVHPLRDTYSVIVAIFAFIFISPCAGALDPSRSLSQYVHRTWTQEQGLFGGTIYALSRSSDGYLWAGTDRGLVRFDGYTFTLIQQPISNLPPIGRVRGLVSDFQGMLWILLDGGHLLLYRNGQFEDAFATFNIPEAVISAISLDLTGRVLISGLANTTLRWNDGKFSVVAKAGAVPSAVTSIAESRDGRIWMGTENEGLFIVENGRVSRPASSLGNSKINALLDARNGGVWVGTDQGIRFVDAEGSLVDSLPAWTHRLQTRSLSWGHYGDIWASTSEGLLRVTPSEVTLRQTGGHDGINAVFEDGEGDLWFGGSGGLEKLQEGIFTTFSGEEGFPMTPVGPIFADPQGAVWFAPLSGGLYWYLDGRLRKVLQDGLDRDIVYSIDGGDGEIWVGRQRGGLTRIVRSGDKLVTHTYTQADGLAQNSVYTVLRSSSGEVWAGTVSAGVSVLGTSGFKSFSSANGFGFNEVISISESRDGTIWMATSSAILEFHNGTWTNYSQKDGLPSAPVRLCFADSKGTLWVATEAGLSYLSGGRINTLLNLPSQMREQIIGITEDRLGSLWFSMPDYVLRVNREALITDSLRVADIQSYGISDGLSDVEAVGRERSLITDSAGKIWIALARGVAVGDPSLTLRDSLPIRVRINSVSANGQNVNLVGSTTIPAGTRSMTFHYESDSLFAPERVRFRYRLDSADPQWSEETESREATYHNLSPGRYRFEVMASREGQFWNSPQTVDTFSINPEFWETWWFRAAATLSVVLFIVLAFRLRSAHLSRELNTRFRERLAERTRIAQELHDTLLQSFQGLMLRFQTIRNMLPARPTEAMIALDDALGRADVALDESRSAIQNIRNSPGQYSDLLQSLNGIMTEMVSEYCNEETRKPTFSVVSEGAARQLNRLISVEVLRIAQEALRNSLQHASASQIEAEVTFGGSLLRIRLRDDGVGIDPVILKDGRRLGHWGIIGMKERAAQLGAKLDLWSKPGAGTELDLKIPARIAYQVFVRENGRYSFRRWFKKGHDLPTTSDPDSDRR